MQKPARGFAGFLSFFACRVAFCKAFCPLGTKLPQPPKAARLNTAHGTGSTRMRFFEQILLALCCKIRYNNYRFYTGAFSSVGQSCRLITGWSGVRVPEGPPKNPNLMPIGSGFGFFLQIKTPKADLNRPALGVFVFCRFNRHTFHRAFHRSCMPTFKNRNMRKAAA